MALGFGLSESEIHSWEHTRRWSRRNPWCPAQWGHFIVDHGSRMLVLKGEERHFDRPMKNLFEKSCGVEKICVLFNKLHGKPLEDTRIRVYTTIPPVWFECWPVLYLQNRGVAFPCLSCQYDSTQWFWQCVHIPWANRTDSMVSSCAQQFVWKHATKTETLNMRGHQINDFSWQDSSLLDFCGDRLWQCSGREQQWRNLFYVFVQSILVTKHNLKALFGSQAYWFLMKTQRGQHNHKLKKDCSVLKS